jgi:hypothetical protein
MLEYTIFYKRIIVYVFLMERISGQLKDFLDAIVADISDGILNPVSVEKKEVGFVEIYGGSHWARRYVVDELKREIGVPIWGHEERTSDWNGYQVNLNDFLGSAFQKLAIPRAA